MVHGPVPAAIYFPFPKAGVLALSRKASGGASEWLVRGAHDPGGPAGEDGRGGGEHGRGLHAPAALSARGTPATGTTTGARPRSRSATARRSRLSAASSRRGDVRPVPAPDGGRRGRPPRRLDLRAGDPEGAPARGGARHARATARSTRRSAGALGRPACRHPEGGLRAGPGGEPGGPAGVCFERAEVFDVVHSVTGAKIAGGAQKRNKRGLLFQGSIWRPAAGGAVVDWEGFGGEFAAAAGPGARRGRGALALARLQRGGARGPRRAVLLARVDGVPLRRPAPSERPEVESPRGGEPGEGREASASGGVAAALRGLVRVGIEGQAPRVRWKDAAVG
jgi:hypothetical protein